MPSAEEPTGKSRELIFDAWFVRLCRGCCAYESSRGRGCLEVETSRLVPTRLGLLLSLVDEPAEAFWQPQNFAICEICISKIAVRVCSDTHLLAVTPASWCEGAWKQLGHRDTVSHQPAPEISSISFTPRGNSRFASGLGCQLPGRPCTGSVVSGRPWPSPILLSCGLARAQRCNRGRARAAWPDNFSGALVITASSIAKI